MLLVIPIVASFLVSASAWALNRSGAAIPADRVGAAGFAIAFAYGHHEAVGEGWDNARPVTWLPLIVVGAALLLPRVAARFGETPVGVVPRVVVLAAIAIASAVLFTTGSSVGGQLELAALGGAIGVLASGLLSGVRDPRVGTWIVMALTAGLVPALRG